MGTTSFLVTILGDERRKSLGGRPKGNPTRYYPGRCDTIELKKSEDIVYILSNLRSEYYILMVMSQNNYLMKSKELISAM